MNAPASRIARTLLLAALASAVAVGCSKKVKEEPVDNGPVDGGASTAPVTGGRPSTTLIDMPGRSSSAAVGVSVSFTSKVLRSDARTSPRATGVIAVTVHGSAASG